RLLRTAGLVNAGNAPLEIHARFKRAQDLVGRTKDPVEEVEFFRKQFKNAQIRRIFAVEKIDHDHIVLLSVTMAAADGLFDTVRIPGQVVIYNQGTELQIDAFGRGFRGNHQVGVIAEVLDNCGAQVDRFIAGNDRLTGVALKPGSVDSPGA